MWIQRSRSALRVGLIGLVALLMMTASHAAEPLGGPVRIRLHADAEVLQSVVPLSGLAEVFGGSAQDRERIAGLDIAEFVGNRTEVEFTSTRVVARLALAGFSTNDYELSGASRIRVTRAEPAGADTLILDSVRHAVSVRFNVPADEVRISLRSPLSSRIVEALVEGVSLDIDVQLPPVVRLGSTSVTIRIPGASGPQSSWPLGVDVELRQSVLVATQPIPSGAILGTSDVVVENRYIAEPAERLTVDEVIGRSTRGDIYPGEVVSSRQLTTPRPVRVEPIVRPRDNVRLVARSGAVEVTVSTAEVLQAGAEGDLVRVRNSESGKTVVGRVVTAELIEVPLY